ncbi:MAG: lytic murein transglycosylase, partial [Solirubrobacterales bacterium]
MARAVNTSLFAVAAAAAATAITGSAAAQDPIAAGDQAGSSGDAQTTTPATPSPVTTTPEGTTDLGTIDVELGAPPPSSKKQSPADKRREAARQVLQENRDARARLIQQEGAVGQSPFAGLSDPLSTPLTTVPDAVLEEFRIPTFLLPIYQAAGVEYGIRWEILAAINEIETDYGRNLSVSTAGAMGWMQFMPGTWESYGTDANRDGEKDPYNPVDAIFSAARYLKASGASESIERAIFSYNHADWYVADVLKRAKQIAALPPDLVGALTGLTMGRAPVTGPSNYAGAYNFEKAGKAGVAEPVSSGTRRSARIYAQDGAGAVAVQDGQVEEIGKNSRLGNFVRLRDGYGNLYTYAHLDSLATHHVVPRADKAASVPVNSETPASAQAAAGTPAPAPSTGGSSGSASKERLFAEPARPGARAAGGDRQIQNGAGGSSAAAASSGPRPTAVNGGELGRYLAPPYDLRRDQVALLPLRRGSTVIAGTILGRVGAASQAWPSKDTAADANPHVHFEIRPAGAGAPRID